jgi:hypothetical protein
MSKNTCGFITTPEQNIPIYKKVDVLVAGSGPGGLGAAIAAARNGANTLLIERMPYLGGMATAALQVWFGGPTDIISGIAREMAYRLEKLGVSRFIEKGRFPPAATGIAPFSYHMSFDPETYKFIVSDMVEEAGTKILVDTWAVDGIVEKQKVKGVIIENKSGRQAILADVVIDATGDADIAARVGVPMGKVPPDGMIPLAIISRIGGINYQKIEEYARKYPEDFPMAIGLGASMPPTDFDGVSTASISGIMWGWHSLVEKAKEKGELQGVKGLGFSLVGVSPYAIKRGLGYIHINVTETIKRLPWDADDINGAKSEGRKRVRNFVEFLKKVPGFEDSFLIDIAPQLGAQDSRRIIGEYVLTRKDIRESRSFEDEIAILSITWPDAPVNEEGGWTMHPGDGSDSTDKHRDEWSKSAYFQSITGVPYRCLIPKGYDGILVAGQTIGMTYMAHEPGSSRNMTTCMNFGQAAGTAAAIAVKQGISPREINIQSLRKQLRDQGVYLDKEAVDTSEICRLVELKGARINK